MFIQKTEIVLVSIKYTQTIEKLIKPEKIIVVIKTVKKS